MVVPQNVQAVWDAQWWMFLHFGAPLCLFAILAGGAIAWWEQRDEDKEQKSNITKLGL